MHKSTNGPLRYLHTHPVIPRHVIHGPQFCTVKGWREAAHEHGGGGAVGNLGTDNVHLERVVRKQLCSLCLGDDDSLKRLLALHRIAMTGREYTHTHIGRRTSVQVVAFVHLHLHLHLHM
jgi:hypothetical protein